MQIVRYTRDGGRALVGVRHAEELRRLPVDTLAELLRLDLAEFRALVDGPGDVEVGSVRLLPPIDGLTELWASGVTYRRSSEARQEESADGDVYSRVYDADRPELFFKSVAWRVVGDGEPIGVRVDSAVNVPEAEVALVINSSGQLVGASICNDVSSRSIEGENPLYLPQAKIYHGSAALGPGITPAWLVDDWYALDTRVAVRREGQPVWQARSSTAQLKRPLDELVRYLFSGMAFPDGAILSTGTGAVPELDFTAAAGDVVEIEVEGLGRIVNPVVDATLSSFHWLTPMPARSPR